MINNESKANLERIEIELLLEGVYRYYGFDFRNYAFSFIKRRIFQLLQKESLTSVSALQEQILYNPNMMKKLFHAFSINVTEMFRDPSFFKTLRIKVIPLLKDQPIIRIWHIGCSTGEEVYSMAILLYEEGVLDQAQIYATDINGTVLEKAKLGAFPIESMQHYTKNYHLSGGKQAFSEYYTAKNNEVVFHSFLKKNIVFAQHNAALDHSINEFHIIICRNVLIYFNKQLQNEVQKLIYESLSPLGFLGLGKREEVRFTSYGNCYKVYDSAEKWYRKIQ
ncbi:protein-glutamate O-methyltransferase CheR [Bacillus taeanensis]|uniref:Protein-glutamate O-methyltransferase CheR n=2 Tax=Bacillus taeanensis TaxID=273032 RepID=A0A366Y4N4_9BACI|nr:protein-glutamate O-methyltransferase CheR [Bacillus taeanensis]